MSGCLFAPPYTPVPVATCPTDGEPLVLTFEWRGFEFYCVVCGRHLDFLEPTAAEETPELMARHAQLEAQYVAERDARKAKSG